jgi:hypothetical protein
MDSVDKRWYAAIVLIALTIGLAAEAGAGGGPKTTLVSRESASAGGDGGDDDSFNPSTSAGGRFTAFESDADNLSGANDDLYSNIYVYDAERKKVELISRRSGNGAGANDASFSPEISASGRYVVFSTAADNLGGPLDTDVDNVYVYDRKEERIKLVSRRSGRNGAGADDGSFSPAISANGRFVAFYTGADNLGGPLDTDYTNIYVYDRERRKVQLISRRSGRSGAGADGDSFTPSLSSKGRLIAFESEATNLGGPIQTNPLDNDTNVYVYDRERRKTRLVSRRSKGAGGEGADDTSGDPFISANGRYVGFETDATNLGGPLGTLASESNIYVYDLERRKVALVSRQSQADGGDGGDDESDDPTLSANGRFVAFETDARNLGGTLTNPPGDDTAYLYDRERKRVELISRQSPGDGGDGGNDDDEDPYVSMDGSVVSFEAESDNLGGPIDAGASNNIYVRIR